MTPVFRALSVCDAAKRRISTVRLTVNAHRNRKFCSSNGNLRVSEKMRGSEQGVSNLFHDRCSSTARGASSTA